MTAPTLDREVTRAEVTSTVTSLGESARRFALALASPTNAVTEHQVDVPVEVAVNNGVAFLDERLGRANWIERANLATLDVRTQRDCVLAQATGRTYVEALDVVRVPCAGGLSRTRWTDEHGFSRDLTCVNTADRYEHLTAAWVRRVTELRATGEVTA